MFIGFLLLLIGALMLLQKLGFIEGSFWEYFWGILLIALGASLIFKHQRSKQIPPR